MKVALFLLLVLLSGCASQTIEPSHYLLRSDREIPSGKLSPSRDFSLGTVEIAAYVDQPGLVMATADGKMRTANHNLWAEPIYDGVRNFLATEIAQNHGEELLPTKLSQNTAVVNIRIDQFHGTLDGKALIVAYWWLERDGEVIALNRFSESRVLETDGYSALVQAEKVLLTELARQISASLATTTAKSAAE